LAKSSKINSLPYNAILHEPPQKKSEVVFILIHHYGGNNKTLKRHIMLVNSLGYAAISFELEGAHNQKVFFPPISKNFKWGLRFVWADRIENILNKVPGEKIIFSLSNPSNSMIDAVHRTKGKNIKAIICDGGPFFDIYKCYWNLFTHAFKYPIPLRLLQLVFGAIYWNPLFYKSQTKKQLKTFSHKIPLLSIRAEDDKLVPVSSIDKCLSTYPKNNITQVLIPDTGHLMGIKYKKQEYHQVISDFLKSKP